ncbi:MAG: DUF2520 domain-containing protein [Bacteroidales bacterium]|jgi:predicted short-subunit dehydrogenase-like oxidoreductase (DUF2520 family)|nr:DUF2520 domain-containing protein [Bacteroidales bacterium]
MCQTNVLIIGNGNVAWHFERMFGTDAAFNVSKVDSRLPKIDCDGADVAIIAVKDDAIAAVADKVVAKGAMVVHTSGFCGIDVLTHCSRTYGGLYPLLSLKKGNEVAYDSMPLCVEANSDSGRQRLVLIAQRLTSAVYCIDSEQRKRLHIAATFANNFTNHLLGVVQSQMAAANLPFEMLFALIDKTIADIKTSDAASLQTGAAFRNDRTTIDAHRALLSDDQLRLYDVFTGQIRSLTKQSCNQTN